MADGPTRFLVPALGLIAAAGSALAALAAVVAPLDAVGRTLVGAEAVVLAGLAATLALMRAGR